MSYEELKNQKVNEIDVEDFKNLVIESFKENREEIWKTGNVSEEMIDQGIKDTLEHKVFGRQRVSSAINRAVRNITSEYNEFRREEALSEMETVDGYVFGGEDWAPSKAQIAKGNIVPDKQSVTILTPRGLWTAGMFGHSANDDIDLIPYEKYRFTYQVYTAENGNEYPTIKDIELLEGSMEELAQWVANEDNLYHEEVTEEDRYDPLFLVGNIGYIDGKIEWVESDTVMKQKMVDGKPVKDPVTGEPVMVPKVVKDGIEPFIQATLDNREEDLFIGTIKLPPFNDEEEGYIRYSDIKFYNKRLGRHHIDIELFRNEDLYDDLCVLSPEEGREFLNDEVRTREDPYLFVVIPTKFRSYTNNDGVVVENVEYKGQFVSDRLFDAVQEYWDKKKVQ